MSRISSAISTSDFSTGGSTIFRMIANSAAGTIPEPPKINVIAYGGSGIVPAALFAIILNIVLPPDEKSEVEIAEEILDMKKKEAQKK